MLRIRDFTTIITKGKPMAGSQDDKAVPFKASNTKRGNKSSYVKNPNPNPKRYKATTKTKKKK